MACSLALLLLHLTQDPTIYSVRTEMMGQSIILILSMTTVLRRSKTIRL
jgi:hypothetical protein